MVPCLLYATSRLLFPTVALIKISRAYLQVGVRYVHGTVTVFLKMVVEEKQA